MALLFFPFLFPAFSCELEQARGEHEGWDMPEGSSTPPPRKSRVLAISVVYEHNVYVAVYAQILQSEKEETIKKNI